MFQRTVEATELPNGSPVQLFTKDFNTAVQTVQLVYDLSLHRLWIDGSAVFGRAMMGGNDIQNLVLVQLSQNLRYSYSEK